jgi:DNA repair protein RecO (recombination protein O)
LIDLFTESHGRITAIARGAKRAKSKVCGLLLPFAPILTSFSGKTELFSLNNAEPNGLPHFLKGDRLLSGFYLNELLFKLLHAGDPHPELYLAYGRALHALDSSTTRFEHESVLRTFEKFILKEIGFGLQLDKTIDEGQIDSQCSYIFNFGLGFSRLAEADTADIKVMQEDRKFNVFNGTSLLALYNDTLQSAEEFKEAKRLLRIALEAVLNNRKIKSRELFI